jgi:hypothetical protein
MSIKIKKARRRMKAEIRVKIFVANAEACTRVRASLGTIQDNSAEAAAQFSAKAGIAFAAADHALKSVATDKSIPPVSHAPAI